MCRKNIPFRFSSNRGKFYKKIIKHIRLNVNISLHRQEKQNIDYRIGKDFIPETATYQTEQKKYIRINTFDNEEV